MAMVVEKVVVVIEKVVVVEKVMVVMMAVIVRIKKRWVIFDALSLFCFNVNCAWSFLYQNARYIFFFRGQVLLKATQKIFFSIRSNFCLKLALLGLPRVTYKLISFCISFLKLLVARRYF